MYPLATLTLLLAAADHWTTYVCLRAPVNGWSVSEANPIAEWLFGSIGLVPGLMLDSVITLAAVAFLLSTRLFTATVKGAFFAAVSLWTFYAVLNNVRAIDALGLSPLGIS